MSEAARRAVRDPDFGVDAYRFEGYAAPFPKHFHDYYVVGCVEEGSRELVCGSGRRAIGEGDVALFHPGEVHACVPRGETPLTYRSLCLPAPFMANLAAETTGRPKSPEFSANVIRDGDAWDRFLEAHEQILRGAPRRRKEEGLLMLGSLLLERYARRPDSPPRACRAETEIACGYMEGRCDERLTLDEICARVHLSKSTLLRAFAEDKGVSPYRYLENIRIQKAKKLLDEGVSPAEAAQRTGFFDQSHFSNRFARHIGVPPGLYQKTRGN